MTYLTPEYRAYINSDQWKAKAAKKKRQVGGRYPDGEPRCEHCGIKKDWPHAWLEVNHLHYLTFMHERMGDLNVLCNGPRSNHCHEKADQLRKARRAWEYESEPDQEFWPAYEPKKRWWQIWRQPKLW